MSPVGAQSKAAAFAGAQKRSSPTELTTVPLKVPRGPEAFAASQGDASASQGAAPALPEKYADESEIATPYLTSVIPWTADALQKLLAQHSDKFGALPAAGIYGVAPLPIQDRKEDKLMSFKEPWKVEQCRQALSTTDMYEAAGNICWIQPVPGTPTDEILAGDPPTIAQVNDVCGAFFSTFAASQGAHSWHGMKVHRLVFPTPLIVHTRGAPVDLSTMEFKHSLRLLTGHAYVYGWWLAMFDALRLERLDVVAALWQCGLTVTLHLRSTQDVPALAVLSCSQSEAHKSMEKMLSDSFPAFAMKVIEILKDSAEGGRMKKLSDLGIKFKGSSVSKAMLAAIHLFPDRLDEDCRHVLREIDHFAGRDALTGGYTKLQKIVSIVRVEAEKGGEDCSSLCLHVLHCLRFAIRYEQMKPKDLTLESLDRGKDGKPGLVQVYLGRRAVMSLLTALLQDLSQNDKSKSIADDLSRALLKVQDIPSYEKHFHPTTSTDADPVPQRPGHSDEPDLLEAAKGLCTHKVSSQALDFGYDLMSGALDQNITSVLKEHSNLMVNQVPWLSSKGMDDLRDLARAMDMHKAVVQVDLSGAPPASTRTLKRYQSEGGDAEMLKERTEVWHKGVTLRKKHCAVGFTKVSKKQDVQTFFEKCPAPFSFAGHAGSQHRVFLFSADLYRECRTASWSSLSEYDATAAPLISFMLDQKGPGDVLVFLDGRSKSWRRELDKQTETARNVSELWIIYKSSPRLGRKVSFASESREVALVSMPVARTQLACKQRKDKFAAAGESSTHDTTYTGVSPMPWKAMPMISLEGKAKIFGYEPTLPREKVFDTSAGVPLFWQERKDPSFWTTLLTHLDAKCIVDLTPGSGSCARAAMDLGISYTALAMNAEHNSWLQNVLNKAAMQVIVREKSPLHEQDLAAMLQTHFQEVLDQLHAQDACKDDEPADDEA